MDDEIDWLSAPWAPTAAVDLRTHRAAAANPRPRWRDPAETQYEHPVGETGVASVTRPQGCRSW